ncbi:UNVERIFIED_CONTAM: hypothetical protein Slati_2132300 [Sesamum latifolium]|uniref:Endonuclease/exonuclease/phosphatase domain-containing protein n=1 Tax=Sesamum latifolium TaxID=2727402 RepID=A0AAW2WS65_9LAMI
MSDLSIIIIPLIGLPLKLDEATPEGNRPNVARICVELDLTKPRQQSLWIGKDGKFSAQPVIYDRCLEYYTKCMHLGHGIKDCREGNEQEQSKDESKSDYLRLPLNKMRGKQPVHEPGARTAELPDRIEMVESSNEGINNDAQEGRPANNKPNETEGSPQIADGDGRLNNGDVGEKESNASHILETIHERPANAVDNSEEENNGEGNKQLNNEEDKPSEGAQNNPIQEICVFAPQQFALSGQGDMNWGDEGPTSPQAAEDEFVEVKAKSRHRRMASHSRPERIMTRSHSRAMLARRTIWSFMRTVAEQASPWFIGGDFNSVISISERSNGVFPTHHSVEDFLEAIFDCGLVDVGFQGSQFTWTDHRLWQRLDRILLSSAWIDGCPNTLVRHLPHCGSDHCPLLITAHPQACSGLKKNCLGSNNVYVIGTDKYLEIFFANLKQAEEKVAARERTYDQDPSEESLIALNRATAEVNHQLTIGEDFWRQKSACKWVVEGERNTRYFHSLVQKKRAHTVINAISHGGHTLTDRDLIQDSAVEFFKNLLSYDQQRGDTAHFFDIPLLLSVAQIEALCAPLTIEEVRRVVFAMDTTSVAGPDGFNALFYQKCWDIVSE